MDKMLETLERAVKRDAPTVKLQWGEPLPLQHVFDGSYGRLMPKFERVSQRIMTIHPCSDSNVLAKIKNTIPLGVEFHAEDRDTGAYRFNQTFPFASKQINQVNGATAMSLVDLVEDIIKKNPTDESHRRAALKELLESVQSDAINVDQWNLVFARLAALENMAKIFENFMTNSLPETQSQMASLEAKLMELQTQVSREKPLSGGNGLKRV